MPHSYIKWTLNVNSNILTDFYATCSYLHNIHKQNCYYNKSSAFQYIIKTFNQDIYFNKITKNNLLKFNTHLKKDKEIGISVFDYQYNPFIESCKKYKISRNDMIRILMIKLVEDSKHIL